MVVVRGSVQVCLFFYVLYSDTGIQWDRIHALRLDIDTCLEMLQASVWLDPTSPEALACHSNRSLVCLLSSLSRSQVVLHGTENCKFQLNRINPNCVTSHESKVGDTLSVGSQISYSSKSSKQITQMSL